MVRDGGEDKESGVLIDLWQSFWRLWIQFTFGLCSDDKINCENLKPADF